MKPWELFKLIEDIDKKNCWKLWRVFQTGKWHCAYGDAEYY